MELQQRLDRALAEIDHLQRENMLLSRLRRTSEASRMGPLPGQSVDDQKTPDPNLILQEIESRFNAEGVDTPWADSVEHRLSNRFYSQDKAGKGMLVAQCRSTLCRLEVDLFDAGAEHEFWAKISAVEGLSQDQIHIQREQGPEGAVRTILYVARDGFAIPRGDES
jgi:hypothetical protein